jgi:hypothetical protein
VTVDLVGLSTPLYVECDWLVHDMTLSCRSRESAFWRSTRRLLTNVAAHSLHHQRNHHNTMESPHPDERPHKKRRFFTEDSSPIQVRTKQPSPRPQTPPPAVDSNEQVKAEANGQQDAGDVDGFDVGMLQAVVGELSMPTIQKLKDVSGNNVERGRRK